MISIITLLHCEFKRRLLKLVNMMGICRAMIWAGLKRRGKILRSNKKNKFNLIHKCNTDRQKSTKSILLETKHFLYLLFPCCEEVHWNQARLCHYFYVSLNDHLNRHLGDFDYLRDNYVENSWKFNSFHLAMLRPTCPHLSFWN